MRDAAPCLILRKGVDN